MRELRPKQRRFVDEYMIDLNATQAAIRAGYSAKTAEWMGPRLVKKTHVMAAISKAQEKRAEKIGRSALAVLKDIQQATKDALAAGNFMAALRGLELEGKHLGMFRERLDVSGDMVIRWQRAGD